MKVWIGKSNLCGLRDSFLVLPELEANHHYSYWAHKNAWSMDGLPGMKRGTVAAKKYSVGPSTS